MRSIYKVIGKSISIFGIYTKLKISFIRKAFLLWG